MKNPNVKQETLTTRATACLWGAAVGDAMGKATEGYTPERIKDIYKGTLRGFVQPVQPLSQFTWNRAEITEDTRQSLAIADSIVAEGKVDQLSIAKSLLSCDRKGIGSSSRLFHFVLTGNIGHVAKKGSGNGAATRIVPIGLINSSTNLDKLVEDVAKSSAMTHGGKSAVAGAAAVAAAIATAIEGWPAGYVLLKALQAAKIAEKYAYDDGLTSVADRIQLAMDYASQLTGTELWDKISTHIGWGFSANQAVPAALITACTLLNAKEAILTAVNHGGDADAVAGISGAIAAALNPPSLPRPWISQVRSVNNLDMDQIAANLIALRDTDKTALMINNAESRG